METNLQSRINWWLNDTSQMLNIDNLNLKKWPDALKGKENLIIKLDCCENQLESIPGLPNLTWLECDDNRLKSILSLPNLTWLCCSRNQLESIPSLPKLTNLFCSDNQLKSIPTLPNLTYLSCSRNQLESIPSLPNLTQLSCNDNQLKSIPSLPKLTWFLDCDENQLFSNNLSEWRRIWPLQRTYINTLREGGIKRFVKTLRLRLYLPRLTQLHRELLFSPYHPGKFYKEFRLGKWSK